ncbi:MAG: rhomboid family intramembrane serine protease [Myxococcales bacterium]|nr:rhomboid family intramembrane serine protease [Myxococcales bacterium]
MDIWSIAVVLCIATVTLEIVGVLRRGAGEQQGYLILLLIDAGLLGYTMGEPRFGDEGAGPWPELIAGVLLCVAVVFVPRLLDRAIRLALARERVLLAARFSSVKELLQPGRATTAERELLADLAAVRAGKLDDVLRALRARLAASEAPDDAPLHERIITVLGFGQRWREAAAHFEGHLRGFGPVQNPALAVQMVRAYGELHELEKAGQIVHRMEEAARAHEPGALAALLQVRLLFLAFVGGPQGIARLLSLPELARLPPRLRSLLEGVALTRRTSTEVPSEEVATFARSVAERVAEEVRGAALVTPPRAVATAMLVGANVAAFVLFVALGLSVESGHDLVRAGASFHAAARAGEWWRLWTAMFLHGGVAHLTLNMMGLYVLGRIVEPIFGWPRFLVIYCAGGLLGNLASVYNPNPAAVLSVGASGAVLGLMGALLVAVRMRRGLWAGEWRNVVTINLLLLTGLQIGLGFKLHAVDDLAHIGGFLGGAAAALLGVPGGRLTKGRLGRIVLAVGLGALSTSAVRATVTVAGASVAETLLALPRHDERIESVLLAVPEHVSREVATEPEWPGQVILRDSVAAMAITPHLLPVEKPGDRAAIEGVLRSCMERDRVAIAKQAAEARSVVPPVAGAAAGEVPGWVGLAQDEGVAPPPPGLVRQLLATVASWFTREKAPPPPRRMLYYGRIEGAHALVVEITYDGGLPLPPAMEGEIARVLGSARVERLPAPYAAPGGSEK